MSRIVDDGAVELEDSTLRTVEELACAALSVPQGKVLLVAHGVAASIAIAAAGAAAKPAAVYTDGKGVKVVCIHTTTSDELLIIKFAQHTAFHASWMQQVLADQPGLAE